MTKPTTFPVTEDHLPDRTTVDALAVGYGDGVCIEWIVSEPYPLAQTRTVRTAKYAFEARPLPIRAATVRVCVELEHGRASVEVRREELPSDTCAWSSEQFVAHGAAIKSAHDFAGALCRVLKGETAQNDTLWRLAMEHGASATRSRRGDAQHVGYYDFAPSTERSSAYGPSVNFYPHRVRSSMIECDFVSGEGTWDHPDELADYGAALAKAAAFMRAARELLDASRGSTS